MNLPHVWENEIILHAFVLNLKKHKDIVDIFQSALSLRISSNQRVTSY